MNPVSIVIPVRIESREREENLRCVVSHLLQLPFVHVDILEADQERRLTDISHERICYCFIADNENVFYRTRYLNVLLKNAEYSIVGVWDTDILVSPEQLIKAIEFIRQGYVFCFPYNGEFRLLNSHESDLVRSDSKNLKESAGSLLMKRPSVGGAFLVNKEKYLSAGGENEGFYGWGPEDIERVKRLEILEYPIARTEGPCYHLFHPRQSSGRETNEEKRMIYNKKVLLDICKRTKEELEFAIRNRTDGFSYMDRWS